VPDSKSTADVVLCFNAGSSSLKFGLFGFDAHGEHSLASGVVSQLGTAQARASLDMVPFIRIRPAPMRVPRRLLRRLSLC
jgi:hypothetical protein